MSRVTSVVRDPVRNAFVQVSRGLGEVDIVGRNGSDEFSFLWRRDHPAHLLGHPRTEFVLNGTHVSPSDLLEYLGRHDAPPPLAEASRSIRERLGPLASSRRIDSLMPYGWGMREFRALAAPFGLGARRILALERAPALQTHFDDCLRLEGDRRILRCVDDPEAFALCLTPPLGRWPPDPGKLRHVLGMPAKVLSQRSLGAALSLPREWSATLPWNPEEAAALTILAESVHPLARLLGSHDLIAGSKGHWTEYLARVTPPDGRLPGECRDVVDMVRSFSREVVRPCLLQAGHGNLSRFTHAGVDTDDAIAAHVLLGGKQLPAILGMSEEWHRGLRHSPAAPGSTLSWPLAYPDVTAPNGIRLVGIGNVGELAAEGRAMENCLPTYAALCHSGECAIVSVRSGDAILSTLEIVWNRDGKAILRQNQGIRNSRPAKDALDAGDWLMCAIEAGDLPRNRAHELHVHQVAQARQARGDDALRPMLSHGVVQDALASWGRLLPRHARDTVGLRRAIGDAVARRVIPCLPRGRLSLTAGRLLPASIPFGTVSGARRSELVRLALPHVAIMDSSFDLARNWHWRIRASGGPGIVGGVARALPHFAGWVSLLASIAILMAVSRVAGATLLGGYGQAAAYLMGVPMAYMAFALTTRMALDALAWFGTPRGTPPEGGNPRIRVRGP